MDINALINMVTDGLSAEDAAVVRKAIERDAVKAKATTLKQQEEYQSLVDAQNTLRLELEGDGTPQKLGARAYQAWYEKNGKAVESLDKRIQAYEAKYGSLEAPTPQPTPTGGRTYTEAEIKAMVRQEANSLIQETYSPTWSNLVTGMARINQRHFYNKRDKPIDEKQFEGLVTKYNGDFDRAYEEYDKPEREKAESKSREDEIDRRVKEKLAQAGANRNFPGSMDSTPGSMSLRTKDELGKFDKTALRRDLANVFVNGEAN
jgi:hypothetical protein